MLQLDAKKNNQLTSKTMNTTLSHWLCLKKICKYISNAGCVVMKADKGFRVMD